MILWAPVADRQTRDIVAFPCRRDLRPRTPVPINMRTHMNLRYTLRRTRNKPNAVIASVLLHQRCGQFASVFTHFELLLLIIALTLCVTVVRGHACDNTRAADSGDTGAAEASSTSTAPQPPPFGGPWDTRPKLTGDWYGLREDLREHGFTFDISATMYYQGIVSGGLNESFEFGGRNDYIMNVDGQKAGLWPGLFINLHGETVYGDSPNLDTGAIVPVSIGRSLPEARQCCSRP